MSWSTAFDCAAIASSAVPSIWPAPGTVRSMTYFGILSSSPLHAAGRCAHVSVRTSPQVVMGCSPHVFSDRPGDERYGPAVSDPGVRLNELLMALSLATDLGFGQPAEHMVRSARLSLRL